MCICRVNDKIYILWIILQKCVQIFTKFFLFYRNFEYHFPLFYTQLEYFPFTKYPFNVYFDKCVCFLHKVMPWLMWILTYYWIFSLIFQLIWRVFIYLLNWQKYIECQYAAGSLWDGRDKSLALMELTF